jgi:hypothetical protein
MRQKFLDPRIADFRQGFGWRRCFHAKILNKIQHQPHEFFRRVGMDPMPGG